MVDEAEADLRTRFTPSFIEKQSVARKHLYFRTDFKASGRSEEQTVWGWRCTLRIMGTCRGRKDRFEIDFSKLALKQETVEICEFFQLNPYLLTSAGSYLVLTEHGEETLEILKNAGVPAVRIGFVKEQNARTLVNGEETRYLDRPAPDELSRWWKERKESEE